MRVSGVKYVQRETPFLATADPPQTTSVAEPLDLPGTLTVKIRNDKIQSAT